MEFYIWNLKTMTCEIMKFASEESANLFCIVWELETGDPYHAVRA